MYEGIGGGLYSGIGGGLYTGIGGGLYTGIGGGLYTGIGGGLYVGLTGGMYTGADSNAYMSNMPPWPHFLRELDRRGYTAQAAIVRQHIPKVLWPEKFFAH
jgi:hypothetical protein